MLKVNWRVMGLYFTLRILKGLFIMKFYVPFYEINSFNWHGCNPKVALTIHSYALTHILR